MTAEARIGSESQIQFGIKAKIGRTIVAGVLTVLPFSSPRIAFAENTPPDFRCKPPADAIEYPPEYETIVYGGQEVGLYIKEDWDCNPINKAKP